MPAERDAEVLVVGAGVGGLAAALALAARGLPVRVLEAAERPGGKVGIVEVAGVQIETGPSVLTLTEVFAGLFARAGLRLEEMVGLRRLDRGFRYRYADGCVLEVAHDPQQTLAGIRSALGPAAEAELASFLAYSRAIWEAAAPHFVLGPAPTWAAMVGLAARHPRALLAVDPLRSMAAGIDRHVREPHLRMLLRRYATYNGSDPRRAPATLNCIAHVELSLGGYGVQGGIHALVQAMVAAIEARGGIIECGSAVERVLVESGAAVGVVLADGGRRRGRAVLVNADVGWLRDTIPPEAGRHLPAPAVPSMSGWTGVLRAARQTDRPPHEVLFPADYDAEFADIFDRDLPPVAPTVYLCAQERCHGTTGWADAEPVFVMANAPAEPADQSRAPEVWAALEAAVEHRARAVGAWCDGDALVWRRTPTQLAADFPGSRGAIYGAASNDRFAAFKRPPNRVSGVPGLYLASGSAHPGGGLPMVALSGLAAADCLGDDLGVGDLSASVSR
jgi:1-hydroxycarotenoid 3,4-desaturase